jgi:hypothetical protein
MAFNTEDYQTLSDCIGETMEALGDWELETRVGMNRDELQDLRRKVQRRARESEDE